MGNSKGYLYFAMASQAWPEWYNLRCGGGARTGPDGDRRAARGLAKMKEELWRRRGKPLQSALLRQGMRSGAIPAYSTVILADMRVQS